MKALFIAYSQAYNEEIVHILELFGQKGFTRWTDVEGRGSNDGLPHMGSHAWPEMNHALITFVEDGEKARRRTLPETGLEGVYVECRKILLDL